MSFREGQTGLRRISGKNNWVRCPTSLNWWNSRIANGYLTKRRLDERAKVSETISRRGASVAKIFLANGKKKERKRNGPRE